MTQPEYTLTETIGSCGDFGSISICTTRQTGEKVIMKSLSSMESNHKDIMREVFILTELQDHSHVVHYIDFYQRYTDVFIIMEYYEMSLHDFIQNSFHYVMNTNVLISLIEQFVSALQHLASKTIIHADLKPENICFKTNTLEHMVMIDFGCARFHQNESFTIQPFQGTLIYASPEAFKGYYTYATDIWGMGVCLYEAIYRTCPFEYYHPHMTEQFMPSLSQEETKQLCLDIREKGPSFELVPYVDQWMLDMIQRMLSFEYYKRPSLIDIKHTLSMLSM